MAKIRERYDPIAYDIYNKEIRKIPLLDKEKEKAFSLRMHEGDIKARNELIESNLRIVNKISLGYKKNWHLTQEQFEDVLQEGNRSLVENINKYKPEQGSFSTFIYPWTREAIKRALYSGVIKDPVHIPYRISELMWNIRNLTKDLEIKLKREPTREEILEYVCKMTGKSEKHVGQFVDFPISQTYIDDDNGEEHGLSILDLMQSDEFSPNRYMVKIEDMSHFNRLFDHLEKLKEKEEDVIRLRYGIPNERIKQVYNLSDIEIENMRMADKRLSLSDVGFLIGVIPERVRQIETRAFTRLKWRLARDKKFADYFLEYIEKPIDIEISDSVMKMRKVARIFDKKTRGVKPSFRLYSNMKKSDIIKRLSCLTEKQRDVIQLTYGINDKESREKYDIITRQRLQQQEFAEKIGVTSGSLSLMKKKAEEKIITLYRDGKLPKRGREPGNLKENRERRLGNRDLAIKALPNIKNTVDKDVINLIYLLDDSLLDINYSFDDMSPSYREIAELLNIEKHQIGYRHKRGLNQLKHYMDLFENIGV